MDEQLKIKSPLPIVYLFKHGKVYKAPFLHLGYKKSVYGVEVCGLYLNRVYAPDSDWPSADALAQKYGERLMKSFELVNYWNARETIDKAMAILRRNGIAADNVKEGFHWGWADWKGPWKDAMYNGYLIPRYFDEPHDLVRLVLDLEKKSAP